VAMLLLQSAKGQIYDKRPSCKECIGARSVGAFDCGGVMPSYICPHCSQPVIDVKVYHHEPEQVTCPYCKTTFKTKEIYGGKYGPTK
jgi:DNA-directed RNA polymerase subunit RPC12/RpoP